MNFLWLLFSFKGRIGRLAFAGVNLSILVINGAMMAPQISRILKAGAAAGHAPPTAAHLAASGHMLGQSLLMMALSLAALWINLAVTTKRLHDIGRSGYWNFYLVLAPLGAIALVIFGILSKSGGTLAAACFIAFAISIYSCWIVMQLYFRGGDSGVNNFGAPGAPGGSIDDEGSAASADAAIAAALKARAGTTGAAPAAAMARQPQYGASPALGQRPAGAGFGRR